MASRQRAVHAHQEYQVELKRRVASGIVANAPKSALIGPKDSEGNNDVN